MGDNSGRTRTFTGTTNQAPLRRNTAQSTSTDVHSSGPTAPRMQTSRSTSSMTTLQHYPSSSFSFPNPSNSYSAFYTPPLLCTHQTSSSLNQGPVPYSAGSHSMQATRSLGGMSSSNNINPSFPCQCPAMVWDNCKISLLRHLRIHWWNPTTTLVRKGIKDH